MKQVIKQYKMKEQLLVSEDKLMEEMEAKMEVAEWEKIEGESPIGYLAGTKPMILEEEFNIYQMTDWSEKVEETVTQEEIDEILNEFQDVVSKGDHDIGNCNLIEHAIRLIDDIPTTCRLRQRVPKENEWIENQIEEMLKNGVIEKSRSPYTANVVVVGKKDGEGKGIDRLCVNFGSLNRKTIVDRYPLPIIVELLRLFQGCNH